MLSKFMYCTEGVRISVIFTMLKEASQLSEMYYNWHDKFRNYHISNCGVISKN